MSIVPGEVIALLNADSVQSARLLELVSAEPACPKCGGETYLDQLYCGGRGYVWFRLCEEADCDYMGREK